MAQNGYGGIRKREQGNGKAQQRAGTYCLDHQCGIAVLRRILLEKRGAQIGEFTIETKDNKYAVGDGMQQGLEYAKILDIPFVFSSNGDALVLVLLKQRL